MSKHDPQFIILLQRTLEGKHAFLVRTEYKHMTHHTQVNFQREHALLQVFKQDPTSMFTPFMPPHCTLELAQLMSAPLASRRLSKAGRSLGSEATFKTSVTPPVISTMAS